MAQYSISLKYPNSFNELLYRVTKWRQLKNTFYNTLNSIKPYKTYSVGFASPEIIDYSQLITSTKTCLDTVNEFYEYCSMYTPKFVLSTDEATGTTTANVQSRLSMPKPLTQKAAENISFDIDNLHKGVQQILKSYGQFDIATEKWIMMSREAALNAVHLIISEYPMLSQIISNFDYPTYTGKTISQLIETGITGQITYRNELNELVTTTVTFENPVFNTIWNMGLKDLVSEDSNMFADTTLTSLTKDGEFIVKSDNTNYITIATKNNTATMNVVDYNTYNNWLYGYNTTNS